MRARTFRSREDSTGGRSDANGGPSTAGAQGQPSTDGVEATHSACGAAIVEHVRTRLTPSLELFRRRDQLDRVDPRRLQARVVSGEWTRVVAGVYAPSAQWQALRPDERHLAVVCEVARRMLQPAVFSHASAAAVWGIDLLGPWPRMVEVRTARTSGGRSHGAIRRHALGLDDVQTVEWNGHRVTTPAQTAIDLARALPFVNAVAAVDQSLWAKRHGGPLTTASALANLAHGTTTRRGDLHVRRVIGAATHLADNVRESQSRLVIAQLGFPTPRLQERRVLPSGRVVFGDFYFPDHDHWAELDGRGKYRSPEFQADRDPADVVIDEKNRENEIRRIVRGFSRWEPRDVDDPRRLYDILTADGLPSRLPRRP